MTEPLLISILTRILLSIPPVILFLIALVFLDSYKLVRIRSVLIAVLWGSVAALVAMSVNMLALSRIEFDYLIYVRYVGPFVEEMTKAVYVVYLIRTKKVGFMVDAAIFGFAIGAGFACIENIYYAGALSESNPMAWLIRGLGTAIMHGGATAIFAIMSKNLSDVHATRTVSPFLSGFAVAFVTHSFFNHFILPPLISTVSVLVVLPTILGMVFKRSENSARSWLGVGFDTDVELLELISKGEVSTTNVGEYLHTLQDKFRPEVLADLLCYLRVYLELSVQAKGILLMREAGFDIPPDPAIQEQFNELQYLQHSIGKTGQLALVPFIHTSSRDLWQLHMLRKSS